jgi:hypothetical protein
MQFWYYWNPSRLYLCLFCISDSNMVSRAWFDPPWTVCCFRCPSSQKVWEQNRVWFVDFEFCFGEFDLLVWFVHQFHSFWLSEFCKHMCWLLWKLLISRVYCFSKLVVTNCWSVDICEVCGCQFEAIVIWLLRWFTNNWKRRSGDYFVWLCFV